MYLCKGGECVLKHRCKNWKKNTKLAVENPLFYIRGNHFYCKMFLANGTQTVRKT